jgi:transposase
MKNIQMLGIDLGKNSCSVVGLDATGKVLLRRRVRREGIIALAAKLPGCVVAMEACCGAHHLGRSDRTRTRSAADVPRIRASLR